MFFPTRTTDDLALVLSGGSLKTMFQISIVVFLEKVEIYPRAIYAISGGVPIALSFILGKASQLEKIFFERIRPGKLFAFDWHGLFVEPIITGCLPILGSHSIFKTKNLDKVIDDEVNFAEILRSNIQLFVAVADLLSGSVLWFSNKDPGMTVEFFRAVVLGSMRIPVFFPTFSCIFKGTKYQFVDAGLINNIPVKRAIEDGFSRVIVVETTPRSLEDIEPLRHIGEIDLRYSDMRHVDEGGGHLKWTEVTNRDVMIRDVVEKTLCDPRVPEDVRAEVLKLHTLYGFTGKRKIFICRINPPAKLSIFKKIGRSGYGTPTRWARSELLGAGYAVTEPEGTLYQFLCEQKILIPSVSYLDDFLGMLRERGVI